MRDGVAGGAQTSASSRISWNASANGFSSVIWLPMCMWMPAASMPGSAAARAYSFAGALVGHAELGLALAGGDFLVGLRVDVGIDAERDFGGAANADGNLAQRFQFRLGLDIEVHDAGLQRERHLARGLADAGENDLRGAHAGRQRAPDLALRHHVHAGAERVPASDHRLVGVGLDREADQCVDAPECIGEYLVVALKGCGE